MTVLVSVTIDSDQVAGWVVGLAALLGAIALLWRYIGRPLRAIWRVVDQEMTNNHGTSMKDDVHGIAVTVGQLSRDVADLTDLPEQVEALSRDLYNHLAQKGPTTP